MNQDNEASSSSPSSPESKILAETVDILLDQCKQLREKVESVRSLNTLTFYSRVIFTAFEAIQTMINRFNTMFPAVEVDEIKACEYCCEKACEIYKEIIKMLSNVILTGSSTNITGGGLKKVPMWKKQCGKNIEKIEFLINSPSLRVYSTWLGAYMLDGILNGVSGILGSLNIILRLKESEEEQEFITIAEEVFQDCEKSYRNIVNEKLDIALQAIQDQKDQFEELSLKNSQEEEALEKLQGDDIPKRFEEDATVTKENLQEEKTQKNSKEVAASLEKLQEEKTQKNSQVAASLQKVQEDYILKRLHEETTVMLKNLKLEETGQKKIQEEDTQKEKNSQEVEINKKLQEAESHKKSHDDEKLTNLKEEKILVTEDEVKDEKCCSGSE